MAPTEEAIGTVCSFIGVPRANAIAWLEVSSGFPKALPVEGPPLTVAVEQRQHREGAQRILRQWIQPVATKSRELLRDDPE